MASEFVRLEPDQETHAVAIGIGQIDTLGDPSAPETDRDPETVETPFGGNEAQGHGIILAMHQARDRAVQVAKQRSATGCLLGYQQQIDA